MDVGGEGYNAGYAASVRSSLVLIRPGKIKRQVRSANCYSKATETCCSRKISLFPRTGPMRLTEPDEKAAGALDIWAIDQPVCVANESGCRPVEADLARSLMADFGCGAHSSNLSNPCWAPYCSDLGSSPQTRGERATATIQ